MIRNAPYATLVSPTSGAAMPLFRLLFGLLLAFLIVNTYYKEPKLEILPSLVQQASPLPTPVRPSTWVAPDKGGTKTFGSVTIVVPAGFTEQSGANVIGDTVPALTTAGRATGIIPGSEFALGIYPNQDQTLFLQPFELRFVLDAAKVSPGDVGSYTIKMYRPGDGSWVELASQFDSSRYALVASVKQFAPVPKDFEFGWGWRTFFGIFKKGGSSAAAPAASSSSSTSATTAGDTKPRTNRGANLRSGPGTEYAVAGYMPAGTEVEMVGKTANGGWFKLSDDRWIAAFLVDNVPTLPTVITSVPHAPATPTATPTGNINNLVGTAIAATLTARAPASGSTSNNTATSTPTATPALDVDSIVNTAIAATMTARAPTPTRTPTRRATSTPTATSTLSVDSIVSTAIAATLTARAPAPTSTPTRRATSTPTSTPTLSVNSIIATSVAATLTAEASKP